jgi:flagellin-like protein
MRHLGRSSRGLAEIVGTLMLVIIVVAAATAFSFFVAAYQKQLTAEETLSHNKSLENLRILALKPDLGRNGAFGGLQVELASLDVNPIVIDSMVLDGQTVLIYNETLSQASASGIHGCLMGSPYNTTTNPACVLDLPPESHAFLSLNFNSSDTTDYSFPAHTNLTINESGLLEFHIFTGLGNEFTQSFVPPVAIAALSFVDNFPILDGANSYQPSSGTAENTTIVLWDWNVTVGPGGNCNRDCGNYSGQEVELAHYLNSTARYSIWLNVTSSDSLVGSAHIDYTLAP